MLSAKGSSAQKKALETLYTEQETLSLLSPGPKQGTDGSSIDVLLAARRVKKIDVLTADGTRTYYQIAKTSGAAARGRRLSHSPTQLDARIISVQKDLRTATDMNRKLVLLKQYEEKDEESRLDGLIEKWREVSRQAVEELWSEVSTRAAGELTRQQFIAALQLEKRLSDALFAYDLGSQSSGTGGGRGLESEGGYSDSDIINGLRESPDA